MTPRQRPTQVFHFTHVNHLESVIRYGLQCDATTQKHGLLTNEAGNRSIKATRRTMPVVVPPGGVVANYVPFYFAPRSPMMSAITNHKVPTFTEGTSCLIYLASSLERLYADRNQIVLTDRNAALKFAEQRTFDPTDPIDDDFIDWKLMQARYWGNTATDDTRVERRMAEALVPEYVSWNSIDYVVVHNNDIAAQIQQTFELQKVQTSIYVLPDWYL